MPNECKPHWGRRGGDRQKEKGGGAWGDRRRRREKKTDILFKLSPSIKYSCHYKNRLYYMFEDRFPLRLVKTALYSTHTCAQGWHSLLHEPLPRAIVPATLPKGPRTAKVAMVPAQKHTFPGSLSRNHLCRVWFGGTTTGEPSICCISFIVPNTLQTIVKKLLPFLTFPSMQTQKHVSVVWTHMINTHLTVIKMWEGLIDLLYCILFASCGLAHNVFAPP